MSFNDVTAHERGGRGADECTELASSVFNMTTQVRARSLGWCAGLAHGLSLRPSQSTAVTILGR